MAKSEFEYSLIFTITQKSVVNVNWHFNKKKKNEIWQIIFNKLKQKKVFLGRGASRNAVAQGPMVILRRPCC